MAEPVPLTGGGVPAGVVVVGSANRDFAVETPVFPAPGETVLGTSVRTSMGGKGANQAVAAALAGTQVTMLARVGNDDAGRDVRSTLATFGVDTSPVVPLTDVPTGTASIIVADGDNAIVVVPGANHAWPQGWPDTDDEVRLARAPIVLAQLEIPLEVVEAAAAVTSAAGGRFVLNAAPAAVLSDELVSRCAVLVVNEHELGVVSGGSVDDIEAAHASLLTRGASAVVTTLGARGAVVTDETGTWTVASPPAEVVDTTGAGDAFVGVLAARLASASSLQDAVRWAAAAGSCAVRSPGTYESYADHDRLARMVDSISRSA